ncbi:MAG: dethiobiotin synthase [Victivallales bacterium]|nr:dethiobiotin synthase [Victivallales bacterium]
MHARPFFITGTGTDIGKTFITAGIAAKAVEAGFETALVKPVQTGTDEYPSDVQTIHAMVPGLYPLDTALAVPFQFKLAASPHLAARMEGAKLELDAIVRHCRELEKLTAVDVMLFEGAGGLYVPLNDTDTMLDLIARLDYPVILVADALLGTINHTMLSVMALRGAGIKTAGVIINNMPETENLIVSDNIATIAQHSQLPILATVKRVTGKITMNKLTSAFNTLDINKLMAH